MRIADHLRARHRPAKGIAFFGAAKADRAAHTVALDPIGMRTLEAKSRRVRWQ
jgi:hypothetical protein